MKSLIIIIASIFSIQTYLVADTSAPSSLTAGIASPPAWMVLGSRTVNYGTDHDVISNTATDTWFTGVYIKVTEAPIKINDMKVYFDNGDKFDVSIHSMIKQNGHSRTIELPGGQRRITKVEFSYETLGSNRGKAALTLWGKY